MEFTDDDDDRDEHLDEDDDDDDGDEGITIPTPIPTAPTTIRNGAGGGSHAAPATTRYRECQKNHAVGIGGHAVDGCGEFMPAGEDGSLDALKCAACGCHRNFHRKESDAPDPGAASSSAAAAAAMHHHHPQQVFPPPYYHRTPVPPPPPPQPYLYHHMHHPHHHRPLALPASSGGRAAEEMEELSNPSSSGGGGGSGGRKKRFRTKFTAEQKERMAEFAERIGWRIQKQDEAAVEQFCREVNVTRQVLKVWLHNNKHSLAPKP